MANVRLVRYHSIISWEWVHKLWNPPRHNRFPSIHSRRTTEIKDSIRACKMQLLAGFDEYIINSRSA